MSIFDLIMKCNNVSMDSFACQTDVKTQDDKVKLQTQQYPIVFTETEFNSFLGGVATENIYYIPSPTVNAIYFNKETMAACPCHIGLMWLAHQNGDSDLPGFKRAIASSEADAAKMDFRTSILAIPDGARSEYFNMLLDKYPAGGQVIPNLFALFFGAYTDSDYGCSKVREDVLRKIIEARRPEDETKLTEALKDYPDNIAVYRGGSYDVSTPPEQAYSWTTNINVADFFAARYSRGRGYIVQGTVSKSKVIYFNGGRGESEAFVRPEDVAIQETIELKGMKDCEEIIPKVSEKYIECMDRLDDLDFSTESDIHGRAHTARVLLLALTIGYYLGLSEDDLDVLGEAAIYHDTCRKHDGVDTEHGYEAMCYYQNNAEYVDPLVEFLIEYHSRQDKDGYKHLEKNPWLNRERDRAELLFKVFKDADALDRVRFGLRSLDMNQLRIPVSKTLPIVANIFLSQIKVD